ncbi:MAG: four helix bundle protein [Caldilineaceae bacterium]
MAFLYRETLGRQIVRSADSVGANIVEGYGRYHYGDQVRFLYIARGSLFETSYWLRRAHKRGLINGDTLERANIFLDELRRKLNLFIKDRRSRQSANGKDTKVSEQPLPYEIRSDSVDAVGVNEEQDTLWERLCAQTDEIPTETATPF